MANMRTSALKRAHSSMDIYEVAAPPMRKAHSAHGYLDSSYDEDLFDCISTGSTPLDSCRPRRTSSFSSRANVTTSTDSQNVPVQPTCAPTLLNRLALGHKSDIKPTPAWYVDKRGIRIAAGMIYVTDIGVRPKQQAWLFLVLGCDIFDDEWQPITATTLERELDPDNNIDPIVIRMKLWSTLPDSAWWRDSDGVCQPGLNPELITDYYDQRCVRTSFNYESSLPYAHYESTSGARVLRKTSTSTEISQQTSSTDVEANNATSRPSSSPADYVPHSPEDRHDCQQPDRSRSSEDSCRLG